MATVALVVLLYVKYMLLVLAIGVLMAGLLWLSAVLRPYIQRAVGDD